MQAVARQHANKRPAFRICHPATLWETVVTWFSEQDCWVKPKLPHRDRHGASFSSELCPSPSSKTERPGVGVCSQAGGWDVDTLTATAMASTESEPSISGLLY